MIVRTLSTAVAAALICCVSLFAQDKPASSASLIANGDFEADANSDRWPDGWASAKSGVSWRAEEDNHFLRLVIAGGLDWAYDLSGIANGFALTEPGGNGIVYSTHIYPWKRDWAGKVLLVADKHPIFVGEVGADTKKMSFIPAEAQEDPATWVPDMLGLIQKHKLHWTGFSFHPKASPVMIGGWDFAPTPFWGQPAKDAISGKRFELKKLR